MEPVLELKNVSFRYSKDSRRVLNDLSYSFEEGKLYAIVGRSGAGKTTLLSLLSGLAVPEKGEVLMKGENIANLDRYHYRSQDIGVIFQSFNLLPKYTALENVLLSMDIAKAHYDDKKQYAMNLLKKVALDEQEPNRRILKLSGGQQQRVAIARALSYDPKIILADEPTGNLDQETQKEIMDIFLDLAHKENRCVIIVTHSPQAAEKQEHGTKKQKFGASVFLCGFA